MVVNVFKSPPVGGPKMSTLRVEILLLIVEEFRVEKLYVVFFLLVRLHFNTVDQNIDRLQIVVKYSLGAKVFYPIKNLGHHVSDLALGKMLEELHFGLALFFVHQALQRLMSKFRGSFYYKICPAKTPDFRA